MSDEKQARERWSQHVGKAVQDLNNESVSERITVAGFLNVLRIEHEDCEIKKEKKQDSRIDVHFREAGFQVTVCLDKGRKRTAELHEQQKKIGNAETHRELWEPIQPGRDSLSPTALTPKDYFDLILSCSQKKWQRELKRELKKYERGEAYTNLLPRIDLLVYINQQSTYLSSRVEPWPSSAPLRKHGWRAVMFVDNYSYARVLYANGDAPDFLRKAVGKTHDCENRPGTRNVFPQTLGPQ